MKHRISPLWWPLLGLVSPILIPVLIKKNRQYKLNKQKVNIINKERINETKVFELPEVKSLELSVLVEWKTKEGFIGDAGVSYLFKTNKGSMLYDIGHGSENKALVHNAKKLNFNLNQIDGLVISHLHKDHMGGLAAYQKNQVIVPEEMRISKNKPCYLPDEAEAEGFETIIIKRPQLLEAGINTTGPLARSLFMFGFTEEQALIIKLKGKGLVIFTGCGHPTIEIILQMVKKISNAPIYAIGGGLHLPITQGRGNKAGFQLQQIFGTGKPPWQRIDNADLKKTIHSINSVNPKKVFLSAHDSCDYALDCFKKNLKAEVQILKAGETYQID